MEKTVYLLDMFRGYEPPEELQPALAQAAVCHAQIDQESRRVTVVLHSEVYITNKQLSDTEQALERQFGVRRIKLITTFPGELLGEMDFSDLAQVIIRRYPLAASTLAGAQWTLEGDVLRVQLRANGKDALTPHLPAAVQYVKDHFDRTVEIQVETGKIAEDADLFAETERIRQEAVAQLDLAAPAERPRRRRKTPPLKSRWI